MSRKHAGLSKNELKRNFKAIENSRESRARWLSDPRHDGERRKWRGIIIPGDKMFKPRFRERGTQRRHESGDENEKGNK